MRRSHGLDPLARYTLLLIGLLLAVYALIVWALVSHASAATLRSVDSTAYCGHGTMKDGSQTRTDAAGIGSVAVLQSAYQSWAPMGSKWIVINGPRHGRTYQVRDRAGSGTQFDLFEESCSAARVYGRHQITVKRVKDNGQDW